MMEGVVGAETVLVVVVVVSAVGAVLAPVLLCAFAVGVSAKKHVCQKC